jgi:hypothetical protein
MSSLSSQKRMKEKNTGGTSQHKNFVGIKVQTSNSSKVFPVLVLHVKRHARAGQPSGSIQYCPEIFQQVTLHGSPQVLGRASTLHEQRETGR